MTTCLLHTVAYQKQYETVVCPKKKKKQYRWKVSRWLKKKLPRCIATDSVSHMTMVGCSKSRSHSNCTHLYFVLLLCFLICTLCFRMCFFNGCKVSSSSNVALIQYAISDTASFKPNLKQGKGEKKRKKTLTRPAAPKTKLYISLLLTLLLEVLEEISENKDRLSWVLTDGSVVWVNGNRGVSNKTRVVSKRERERRWEISFIKPFVHSTIHFKCI